MSQTPITVTYSLEEILKEIKQEISQVNQKLDKIDEKFEEKLNKIDEKFESKLDKIDERFNNLEKEQTRVTTKLENLEADVRELKGSSKAQIWTLIGILITAVGGFLVAVGRLVISGKP